MATERVTITIDKEVLEEARTIAKTKGQSLSKTVSEALKTYLIEHRRKKAYSKLMAIIEKNPMSEKEHTEAMREIDRIREEMERW